MIASRLKPLRDRGDRSARRGCRHRPRVRSPHRGIRGRDRPGGGARRLRRRGPARSRRADRRQHPPIRPRARTRGRPRGYPGRTRKPAPWDGRDPARAGGRELTRQPWRHTCGLPARSSGLAAVDSQLAAADAATSVCAHEQAEVHLRRALHLVRQASPPDPDTELSVLLSLFRPDRHRSRLGGRRRAGSRGPGTAARRGRRFQRRQRARVVVPLLLPHRQGRPRVLRRRRTLAPRRV